jgi:phenylpyruvate tautomerase PptA (4-oxalocrotonate tautomerase family)
VVPHLDVYTLETDLTGRENTLIEALTSAVAAVYGEWARPSVVVRLIGLPAGRWGIGGRPAAVPAPSVTFGIRADALDRPDAATILNGLATGITDAIAAVLGEQHREGTTVEFVAQRPDHFAVGGKLGA